MDEENFLASMGGISVEKLRDSAKAYRKANNQGCEDCNYFGHTVNSIGQAVLCSCTKKRMYAQLYDMANIPRRLWHKTLDDWDTRSDADGFDLGIQRKTSERVLMFLNFYKINLENIIKGYPPLFKHSGNMRDKLHSIIFEGTNGSGKTFISSVLTQYTIQKGRTAKFYDWTELIPILTDYEKKDEMEKLTEEFKNLDFIAIDGLESYPSMPPLFITSLDRISKARINSGKPIIFTTNGSYSNMVSGSGWQSLISKCIVIKLPKSQKL